MAIGRFKVGVVAIFVMTVYSFSTLGAGLSKSSSSVRIDENATRATQKLLQDEVETLMALNSEEFKGIDFKQLKKDILKLTVLVNSGTPMIGSGYRNGGVNFAGDTAYVLNLEKLESYSRSQSILMRWHEALGALGYNDENYLVSIAIVQKLAEPTRVFHPEIKKRITQQLHQEKMKENFRYKSFEGGATAVGGGGDGDIAEVKSELFNVLNYWALENQLGSADYTAALLNRAIDTPVESIEFQDKYTSVFEYEQIKVGRNNFTGKLSILVDTTDWQAVDSLKGQRSERNNTILNRIIDVLEVLQLRSER